MVTYEILSEPGEREYNEDYAGAKQHGEDWCFVLADGLGGHGGGDEASRMVSEYILNDFDHHDGKPEAFDGRAGTPGQGF